MEKRAIPIVVESSGGHARWFLGTLATIKVAGEQTGGRLAVWEALLPKDAAPPLHTHPEDETFYVLEGELTAWIGGEAHRLTAGSLMFAPGGTPHTFLVHTRTARVLTLSTPAGIENMINGLGVPAKELCLPPDDVFPSDEEINAGYAACRVEIVGPRPTR